MSATIAGISQVALPEPKLLNEQQLTDLLPFIKNAIRQDRGDLKACGCVYDDCLVVQTDAAQGAYISTTQNGTVDMPVQAIIGQIWFACKENIQKRLTLTTGERSYKPLMFFRPKRGPAERVRATFLEVGENTFAVAIAKLKQLSENSKPGHPLTLQQLHKILPFIKVAVAKQHGPEFPYERVTIASSESQHWIKLDQIRPEENADQLMIKIWSACVSVLSKAVRVLDYQKKEHFPLQFNRKNLSLLVTYQDLPGTLGNPLEAIKILTKHLTIPEEESKQAH